MRTAAPNTPKAKEAILSYQIQGEKDGLTLAEIQLETGRPHQIRVQFASRRTPLWGDQRYNPQARPGPADRAVGGVADAAPSGDAGNDDVYLSAARQRSMEFIFSVLK